MTKPATAILHYSSPPTAGGVEAAILAHARELLPRGIRLPWSAVGDRRTAFPKEPGLIPSR